MRMEKEKRTKYLIQNVVRAPTLYVTFTISDRADKSAMTGLIL